MSAKAIRRIVITIDSTRMRRAMLHGVAEGRKAVPPVGVAPSSTDAWSFEARKHEQSALE